MGDETSAILLSIPVWKTLLSGFYPYNPMCSFN